MHTTPATLDGRAVIHLAGPDARALLQRVVTGDAEAVAPDRIIPAALLTPQGKIIVDFLMHAAPDGLYLDVVAEAAPALAKKLTLYKLRADVQIALREDLAVIGSQEPLVGAARDPRSEALGWRAIGEAVEARRDFAEAEIAAGVPAFGRDYGEAEVFPTDVNLDLFEGVAWTKGCYVGQEVVSRMKRRGTIRKRTLPLRLTAPAGTGATVVVGEKTVGAVTSAQGEAGLALLRLDRWQAADGPVTVDGQAAEILRPDWLEAELAALDKAKA